MNTLEVCCGSLASAVAAVEGGARRIELCSALSLDGLTPSIGLIRELRHIYPDLLIHVLIRPREGDFVYTEAEVRVIADGFSSRTFNRGDDVRLQVREFIVFPDDGSTQEQLMIRT